MRLTRTRAALAVGALALGGGGVPAGTSIAGGEDAQPTAEVAIAEPVTAVAPANRAASAAKKRKGRGPTVQFLFARQATVPPQGGSLVQPVRCPAKAGNPIAGGIRPAEGLVVSYLSRVHPSTNKLTKRTYFVGVRNVSAPAGAGALAEVQCAKGIRVIAR